MIGSAAENGHGIEIGEVGGGQADSGRDLVVGAALGTIEKDLAEFNGDAEECTFGGVKRTVGDVAVAAAAGLDVGKPGEDIFE